MSAEQQFVPRILIAEDSPVSRKLLETILAEKHYDLCFAKNGREALDVFAQFRPDIIVTDWVMPDVSGVELCRQVRKSQGLSTYIILVTQKSEKEDLIEGLDAGADDYLTKPFDAGELLARIRVGCRTVQMSREIEAKNALLEKAARTDHLTGLPNRLAVEEFAGKQLSAAIRHKFNLWVIVADLDKFKLVNDTYGHFGGDETIKRFATILTANTRSADMCGRLGGDEFLIVMSHGNKKSIVQTIERLRADFAIDNCTVNGQAISATASFGVAGFDGTAATTLRELLTNADHALYDAKASGRNLVRAHVRIPTLNELAPAAKR
ncbi:MAG TPA: diguanylate cyclase [Candidatus Acidoferrum sp.]|nr:diguanylate cyclase [Candidatus Acidoferrum sp.]